MLPPVRGDLLADKRYVTVFLRLLLGRHGRLEHGELVDLDGVSHGRFTNFRELTSTLRAWIATRERQGPPQPEEGSHQ